jgi:hypothetical protein
MTTEGTGFILFGLLGGFTSFIFVMRTMRRMRASLPAAPPPQPFDLAEIRSMLDQGKITADEYDRLRGKFLQKSAIQASAAHLAGAFEVIAKAPADSKAPIPAAPLSAHTPSTDNPPAANRSAGV